MQNSANTSPHFCTHPGGYKMCVRVDANGFGSATGTYVSVYAYLMKGKMMTPCYGPSQKTSPSHCSTNWKMRTTTSVQVFFDQTVTQAEGW